MAHPPPQLPQFVSVADFDEWVEGQPGSWELHDGTPVAMAPERADHGRIKGLTWALNRALRSAELRCEALLDSLMVPGPQIRKFKPDVLVACGPRVDGDDRQVNEPVIIVEVLSPSTEDVDTGLKLESYFALPSVQHYLLVSSRARRVIHLRRWDSGRLMTSIHHDGAIELDPPGINILIEDLYTGTNLDAAIG